MLLHFWSPSCVPCMRLEKDVFSRAEVGKAINDHYIAVKVNADEQPQLAEQYGVRSIPCDVVVTPTGQIVYKTVSPSNAESYVQKLVSAAQPHGPDRATTQPASRGHHQRHIEQLHSDRRRSDRRRHPTGRCSQPGHHSAGQRSSPACSPLGPATLGNSTGRPATGSIVATGPLKAQTQQFIDQSGQRVNTQMQRGVDQLATAAQPTGEAISKTAEQVAQTAQSFQSGVQQVQRQAAGCSGRRRWSTRTVQPVRRRSRPRRRSSPTDQHSGDPSRCRTGSAAGRTRSAAPHARAVAGGSSCRGRNHRPTCRRRDTSCRSSGRRGPSESERIRAAVPGSSPAATGCLGSGRRVDSLATAARSPRDCRGPSGPLSCRGCRHSRSCPGPNRTGRRADGPLSSRGHSATGPSETVTDTATASGPGRILSGHVDVRKPLAAG